MRLVLLCGALLAAAAPATLHAQTAPAAAGVGDEAARRAEARAIIAVMFPPAAREAMIGKMMENINATMLQGLGLPTISDPGLKAIFDRFVSDVQAQSIATARGNFPQTLVAMEGAYARTFTLPQLKAVHAFADTPAGAAYLQRSLTLMEDPEVRATILAGMTANRAASQQKLEAFRADVMAYLKAHPDVAAQINAETKAR